MQRERCPHPTQTVAKFPKAGRPPAFHWQCDACLEPVGRELDPLELPPEIDPAQVLLCRFPRKQPGTLGGRGNSKRRAFTAFYRSSRWKRIRLRVLERDGYRCADCGARATCVAHIRYPENIVDTTERDCKASCDQCNQREREQRITSAVLGG